MGFDLCHSEALASDPLSSALSLRFPATAATPPSPTLPSRDREGAEALPPANCTRFLTGAARWPGGILLASSAFVFSNSAQHVAHDDSFMGSSGHPVCCVV